MAKILITGATSGIGEALAKEASRQGHQVIACGRNTAQLKALETLYNMQTLQFDVSDQEATKTVMENVECDIVVLNAGTCEYVDIEEIDIGLFKRVFDVNFFGTINVLSAILPNLKKDNKIVFIDSMARLLPFTKSEAYGASKAALHYASKSFAVDLHGRGIKVQSISPGFVETPLTRKNNFPMPMSINAEQAGVYMLKGILSSRSSIYFPRRFGFLLRFLNLLPATLQNRMCLRMRSALNSPELANKNVTEDHE